MGGGISRHITEAPVERKHYIVGGITAGVITAGVVFARYRYKKFITAGETDRETLTEPDFIYLFTPPRIGVIPNLSPFAVKLEAWFRLVKVPFKVIETIQPSSKKQFPYIILNGEEIADSRFIAERISQHFNKPLYPGLSTVERAVAIGFTRLLEENTLCTYLWYRYINHPEEFWDLFSTENKGILAKKMLVYAPRPLTNKLKIKLWYQGTARHKQDEIYSLAETDLRALSDYLGDKDYFFGEKPCLLDCVAFGHLVQIVYLKMKYPPRFYVSRECENLMRFLERMKTRLYPDWDTLCNI